MELIRKSLVLVLISSWYRNISTVPSQSVFINSGVIMGQAESILTMLSYILLHNQSYLTYNTKKKPPAYQFHDQHAVADYSIRIAPHLVSLDYHQQFAGSFGIEVPGGDKNSPVVCKRRDGNIAFNCKEISVDMFHKYPSTFPLNSSNCLISRQVKKNIAHYHVFEAIAGDPVICSLRWVILLSSVMSGSISIRHISGKIDEEHNSIRLIAFSGFNDMSFHSASKSTTF
jgi:hypothetical protein